MTQKIKILEDTVIKIYHQQVILLSSKYHYKYAYLTNFFVELQELSQKQRKYNKKVTIQNTMNYSSKQNQSYCGGHFAHYAASDFCENEQSTAPIVTKLIEKASTNRNDDDKDKENKQQPNLYQFMSNNDVKMLIKELKKKVDYTERMNWLCEYFHQKFNNKNLLFTIKFYRSTFYQIHCIDIPKPPNSFQKWFLLIAHQP